MHNAEPRPARLLAAACALAVLLSGCVSPAYRDSVGQFGTLTKAAVAAQNTRLDSVAADETERVHADLANRRVELRWTKECAALLAAEVPVPGTPPCRLIEAGGKPVEAVSSYDHVRGLGAALSDYSDNLIALAADSTADRQAFAASVAGLATSLGGLDGAIREATGAKPASSTATLDGVGALVGKAGGLILAAQRAHALKRIVRRADPLVQEAVGLLTDVDNRLGVYDMATRGQALAEARNRLAALVHSDAAVADIRAAQDDVFAKFAAFGAGAVEQQHYAAIGIAHHKLALAADDGATPAQVQEAILAIIDLASTTSDLLERPEFDDLKHGKREAR